MRTAAFPLRTGLWPVRPAAAAGATTVSEAGAFVGAGLLRRSAPFLGAMALALLVLALPPAGDGVGEILLAVGLTLSIVASVWVAPWHLLPRSAEVVPPLAYFVVIAMLRDSQGGALSGYDALAMLPVFWLALYGTPSHLAVGIAGVASMFLAPLALLGAPEYPTTEWRRAILWICVAPIVGYTVQALVAELRTRAEETRLALANIEAVTTTLREIGASTDPDAVRRSVCSAARDISGAEVVQLLETSDENRLTLTASVGMRIPRAGEEAGAGLAHISSKPVFLRAAPRALRHGVRSMHFEPVLRQDEAVAVLVLGWAEEVKRLPMRVASGMGMLAAEAAIALDRARLLAQLEETARTDDLTGLPNRRAWEEELPRELARAARDSRPVCVAMLDLDCFKLFNDGRGHQAGDRLLKQAAAAWTTHLRTGDMLARYGGEEFSLLLPGCKLDDAQALVERLRAAMPDGETVSAGIACWDEVEDAETLLGRADAALYAAKRGGRDRLVTAT